MRDQMRSYCDHYLDDLWQDCDYLEGTLAPKFSSRYQAAPIWPKRIAARRGRNRTCRAQSPTRLFDAVRWTSDRHHHHHPRCLTRRKSCERRPCSVCGSWEGSGAPPWSYPPHSLATCLDRQKWLLWGSIETIPVGDFCERRFLVMARGRVMSVYCCSSTTIHAKAPALCGLYGTTRHIPCLNRTDLRRFFTLSIR